MTFRDLTEVLGSEPKVLPIRGTDVEFPGRISARTGTLLLKLQEEVEAGNDVVDDLVASGIITAEDAIEIEDDLLGDGRRVLDEMGVVGQMRQRVVETLTAWHLGGEEAAIGVWEGKALNREQRRKVGKNSRAVGKDSARSRTGNGASSASLSRSTGSGSRSTSA